MSNKKQKDEPVLQRLRNREVPAPLFKLQIKI